MYIAFGVMPADMWLFNSSQFLKRELQRWSEKYNIPVYGFHGKGEVVLYVKFLKEAHYTMFLLTWDSVQLCWKQPEVYTQGKKLGAQFLQGLEI